MIIHKLLGLPPLFNTELDSSCSGFPYLCCKLHCLEVRSIRKFGLNMAKPFLLAKAAGPKRFSVFFSRSCFFVVYFFPWMLVVLNLPSNFFAFLQFPCVSCIFPWFSVICLNSCRILLVLQTSLPTLLVQSSFDRVSSLIARVGYMLISFHLFSSVFLATYLHFPMNYLMISSIQSPHHFVAGFCFRFPSFLCLLWIVRNALW